jgi:hypothetical protein
MNGVHIRRWISGVAGDRANPSKKRYECQNYNVVMLPEHTRRVGAVHEMQQWALLMGKFGECFFGHLPFAASMRFHRARASAEGKPSIENKKRNHMLEG